MFMVTSLNMDWKLPIAYCLIADRFKSANRAELLRQCIYKLNATGAVITNIVMDTNYTTYRSLGCKLCRSFKDLKTSSDIQNNLGKYVMALFDPPHVSKLGMFFNIIYLKLNRWTMIKGDKFLFVSNTYNQFSGSEFGSVRFWASRIRILQSSRQKE